MAISTIFTQLSLILLIVVAISIVMRALHQPLIMGYILTGVLVGPSFLHVVGDTAAFDSFSTIGITLLLFIIGLGLNANIIRSLGKVSFITSMSVLPILGGMVFFVSRLLGYDARTAGVLAAALFFSSTIIVMKALSDKKETTRLYGQIDLGILLIEDLVATIAIVVVAMIANPEQASLMALGLVALKALALAGGLFIAGKYIMPYALKQVARSQELLFLFSIAWGLTVASLFELAGFSHEVGALFAGVSLASVPYAQEMAAKLKPLRDFFIVIFFVMLGESFTVTSVSRSIMPALILAMVILIGKPLITFISLELQGYTKLTAFKTAAHLSQISEFSIIFATIAASKGIVGHDIISLVTLVAFITIGVSAYIMKNTDKLYKVLEKPLTAFERTGASDHNNRSAVYTAILIGYHKGGYEYVKVFRELKERYLVIDYDPLIIDTLEDEGIHHAYGDATDMEFLDEFNVARAKLVVSTMTDYTMNTAVLCYLREHSQTVSFICHANSLDEANKLYEAGASYVTLPHYIGSERMSGYIKRYGYDHDTLKTYHNTHSHAATPGKQAML